MQKSSATTVRGIIAALIVLAIFDLFVPRVTVAILYAIPLVLLAQAGYVRPLWRSILVFVALIYGVYALKYALWPIEGESYFSFRLVNRTFIALMIWLVAIAVEVRREMEHQSSLEDEDPYGSLSADVRATMSILLGAPLVLLIATIDVLLRADYNFAVLYPVALLVFALSGSRRQLWLATAVLATLVVIGYFVGPGPTVGSPAFLLVNRTLTVVLLLCLAAIIDAWIRPAKTMAGARDKRFLEPV